jgi:hypothetical protein
MWYQVWKTLRLAGTYNDHYNSWLTKGHSVKLTTQCQMWGRPCCQTNTIRTCRYAYIQSQYGYNHRVRTKIWFLKRSVNRLGTAQSALHRLGTAQTVEVKLNVNKWKAAHCIGSARLGSARLGTDLSARIGTVPAYLTEKNVPKVRSVRKVNNRFEAKSFLCFPPVIWLVSISLSRKQASFQWVQLIETVHRYSNLYDSADKYYHDILRIDNA